MSQWLEDALLAMPAQGRLGLKVPGDLAFGFTDDRKTEKGNQDRLAVAYCLDSSQCGERWFFAGVCDGVGGEAQGEVAASIALAEIVSELCAGDSAQPEKRLNRAITRAHAEVQRRLQKRSATTFAGLLIGERGRVSVGWVGDSRVYSIATDEIVKLSQDDTLAEMLRRKMAQPGDKNVQETIDALAPKWQESLGQAIGSAMPLQPRSFEWDHIADAVGCLLCTDGVWKPVESVLDQAVRASGDRQDLARRLLTLTEQLGGTDNATAIVVPKASNILRWLRGQHRASEQGLVHVVLPGDATVVPWSLFKRSDFWRPQMTPKTTVPSKQDHKPESAVKRKSRNAKIAKAVAAPEIQLTFAEGAQDDETSATATVRKDQ